jgi:secretion/DNA translocation related CpaE-like protein
MSPTLVDLDPLGGGLDLPLGAEDLPGLRWDDLASARGRLQPGLLTTGLPQAYGVRLVTWSRQGLARVGVEAVTAVLDAARRESGLVVVDLARNLEEPAARHVVQATTELLLVVPAEVRATAAAGRLLDVLEPLCGRIRLVVRGPAPTGLSAEAVADALVLPLAGQVRPEPGLAAALDRGLAPPLRPRGPLARLCRGLVSDLRAA